MRLLKHSCIISLLGLLLFNSCKNKLELNAPYKEIPIVHALLNPYEDMQMIRINKAFLGEGDANQMAKVADSVNYPEGELLVTLDRYSNGVQINACPKKGIRTIVFKDSIINTISGPFTTTQRVYITHDDLKDVSIYKGGKDSIFGDYVLTIKNQKTGNVFTAKSSAIVKVDSNQAYGTLVPPYYKYPDGYKGTEFIDYTAPTTTVNVKPIYFRPVARGAIYQVIVRTVYHSFLDFDLKTYFDDYTDFVFDDPKTLKAFSGVNFITVTFKSGDYFANMGQVLARKGENPNVVGRQVFRIDYIIHAATQDYVDWLEFSKPSFGLSQTKPLYSNFTDKAALGIFSFRSTVYIKKQPNTTFVNAFSYNTNTCKYNFYDFNNKLQGCK